MEKFEKRKSNIPFKILISIRLKKAGNWVAKRESDFFYYRIYAKDLDRKIVSFNELIKNKPLPSRHLEEDPVDKEKEYTFEFNKLENGFYYGQIIRARNNKEYSTLLHGKEKDGWKCFPDLVGKGIATRNDEERANFVMGFNENELLLLVQRVAQYPGVGKLTNFFNAHFKSESVEVKYGMQRTDKSVKALKEFLTGKKAQELRIDMKSDSPDIEKESKLGLIDTLKILEVPGYRLEIKVVLDKRKRKEKATSITGEKLLGLFFGNKRIDALIDILHKDDVVNRFHKIQLVAEESEGKKVSMEKNILDMFEQEKIFITKVKSNLPEETINELVILIEKKIEQLKEEKKKVKK
jgi:hypothetical protein